MVKIGRQYANVQVEKYRISQRNLLSPHFAACENNDTHSMELASKVTVTNISCWNSTLRSSWNNPPYYRQVVSGV